MSDNHEMPHFDNVDEYVEWVNNTNPHFNPFVCLRHWWPIVKKHQEDNERASYGLLMTVILTQEAFAFLPDDVARSVSTNPDAVNSYLANQTVSVCCKLGDEKMEWLHQFLEDCHDNEKYCRVAPYPWRLDCKGRRVCWFKKDHEGQHEWELPLQSVFALMGS